VNDGDAWAGVRKAGADDLTWLQRLADDAAAERRAERGGVQLEFLAPRPALDELEVRRADSLVLCGLFEGILFGFAHARCRDFSAGHRIATLYDLYVQPDAREVGVGEALIESVFEWARSQSCEGVDAVVLPGNRSAKNFFERFGLVARAIAVYRAL
jgi:ribosomal protein S18 acetylase RimI-like enzyme